VLQLKTQETAALLRKRAVSSVELIQAHLDQIERIQPSINAVTELMADSALEAAQAADECLAAGKVCGPLHGIPFSVKDSIDVAGARSTAGTLGFRNAPGAEQDATLVRRLREAGGIPIAKTNLPDLLFSFETDNLIFGRTNNPYDLSRTPGGSSGGESALIAACGSPLGLGSDCLGSVRVPAAFCGIASIKPTSGRLPRTGHVPPRGGWIERLWQIGPMARWVDDVELALRLLAHPDGVDWTSPPVLLAESTVQPCVTRVAFFTDNGIVAATPQIREAIVKCAQLLDGDGVVIEERKPSCIDRCYELELAILGADGCAGIDDYLRMIRSETVHPLTANFLDRMRPYKTTVAEFALLWAAWDSYIAEILQFFKEYDAVLCPVYPQTALAHRDSMKDENFAGFSHTMAWSLAGFPAATVRCGEADGLPINVQVVTKPWADLTALDICKRIETASGGWQQPKGWREVSGNIK
jgi:amidase